MTRVGKIICAVTFVGFVVISGNATAEIYKWVDANGKVHYSDRKVDAKAVTMDVSTGTTSLGDTDQDVDERLMQQNKYLNYLTSERLERQEKRTEVEKQKAKQKKYCNTLQDQLNSYTNDHVSWYELDEETGERNYLSDDKLDQRINELQSEIKTSCG